MPRTSRVDGPGLTHHVTARGATELRQPLFADALDRDRFTTRARAVFVEAGVRCLAWALLADQVHLVVTTGAVPLARAMQRLTTGYAHDHHHRHDRSGHLYAGRYKSLLLGNRAARRALVRYVHLRPVVAGEVADVDALGRHPWSGHASLLGQGADRLVDVRATLALFGARREEARASLLTFMADSSRDDRLDAYLERGRGRPPSGQNLAAAVAEVDGRFEGVTGSTEFVATVLAEADATRARVFRLRCAGWTLSALTRWVCAELSVDPRDLVAGRRTRPVSAARAAIAWLATDALGEPAAEVAAPLGVSPSALSRALNRGRDVVESALPRLPAAPPG